MAKQLIPGYDFPRINTDGTLQDADIDSIKTTVDNLSTVHGSGSWEGAIEYVAE